MCTISWQLRLGTKTNKNEISQNFVIDHAPHIPPHALVTQKKTHVIFFFLSFFISNESDNQKHKYTATSPCDSFFLSII